MGLMRDRPIKYTEGVVIGLGFTNANQRLDWIAMFSGMPFKERVNHLYLL